MKYHRAFHYYPVDVKQSYTGKNVRDFKFPANGRAFEDTNIADVENVQQFQLYFGINEVISSIEDLQRTGTTKSNKLYRTLLGNLKKDYDRVSIFCLELASSMCWIPVYDKDENDTGAFQRKLTPDRALFEIEPAAKGLLLAVQTKMDLLFPTQLVKHIARLEIDKELLEFKEDTFDLKKSK